MPITVGYIKTFECYTVGRQRYYNFSILIAHMRRPIRGFALEHTSDPEANNGGGSLTRAIDLPPVYLHAGNECH